ncbi:hypothetical protein BD560DRAFT_427797 [Blakeslea trispora]|nr:hypothetical protein BD560DRAFT_427797 [Blakeslea trispora]
MKIDAETQELGYGKLHKKIAEIKVHKLHKVSYRLGLFLAKPHLFAIIENSKNATNFEKGGSRKEGGVAVFLSKYGTTFCQLRRPYMIMIFVSLLPISGLVTFFTNGV